MRNTSQKARVLVLAPNEYSKIHLEQVPNREAYEFRPVYEFEELISNEPTMFDDLAMKLDAVCKGEHVDGIVAFWDFPATCLAAYCSEKHGLPTPGLEAVIKCEHKHWSRILQKEVAPEVVPKFERVDPFDDEALSKLTLPYPFWLKPIKGVSSMLGFRIENKDDFERAITATREKIHILADSFAQALRHCQLPDQVRAWGAHYCLAEEIIGGEQVTLEGFVVDGQVRFHGVVDSIRHTNESTFSRYQYPSRLADEVVDRMKEASQRVLKHIGYDWATFNIEFFYDEEHDQIWLLEINSRISQSHAALFHLVDGAPNFSELVSCALGEQPSPRKSGKYQMAAKLFYRSWLGDGIVTAVPSREEIRAIEESIVGVEIQVTVRRGQRLSEMPLQDRDSYTYELAQIHAGGDDEGEILRKYQECVDRMTFSFEQIEDAAPTDGHARVSAADDLRAH